MFAAKRNTKICLFVRFVILLKIMAAKATVAVLLYMTINLANAAEDTVRGSTAATMPHPELSPEGIRRGSFVFRPSIGYSLDFNDNVFATENNKESSYVTELAPTISASSDWNSHALNFTASSVVSQNHEFSSEDYTDWNLDAGGLLDISRNATLSAGAGIGREHIPRSAPDDERGTEPTEFDRTSFFTRYLHKTGRMVGVINLNILRKEYLDVDAIRLGVPVTIDNSDRDRTESRLRLRVGYRYVGDEQVFVSLEGFDRDYDTRRNISRLDQSSTGLETLAGFSFDYHGILLGEFAFGYRTQDYERPLEDIETPIVKANILWNLTDLTTASFVVDQKIQESIDRLFSGYTSTTTSVGLDHELRRNLLVNLSLNYVRDEYTGIGAADRDDETYYIEAGSRYRINRNLFFNARFIHEERKSDLNIAIDDTNRFDFDRNLISLQLQAQF